MRKTPTKSPNKQQLRTRETQLRLLNAAEEVFVRDGFETAQLDEIAALAGRSKGAVYMHFKSKEDLFLVLFEHRTRLYIDRIAMSLKKCTTQKQSREAFRDFYISLVQDKAWSILTLEFKLYALRHPGSKERYRKVFEMSKATSDESLRQQLFGKLTRNQEADNELSLVALGPVLSSMILESHFEPKELSEKALSRILGRIFDALFPPRR